jgi:hypothetical protein
MHSWEPTECLGIQILTIKLLLVISIVFVFFGTPCIAYCLYYRSHISTGHASMQINKLVRDFRPWLVHIPALNIHYSNSNSNIQIPSINNHIHAMLEPSIQIFIFRIRCISYHSAPRARKEKNVSLISINEDESAWELASLTKAKIRHFWGTRERF